MLMVFRNIRMMAAIVGIERNNVNGMEIVGGMGMRRRSRRHAVLRERNHKNRRQYRSQEFHGPSIY